MGGYAAPQRQSSNLFYGYPHAVSWREPMTLQRIDIEPEGIGAIVRLVLRHEAVLELVHMTDKFQLSRELYLLCHAENEWERGPIRLSD